MKLWSIHPKYLDKDTLFSCWEEALKVKTIIENRSRESNLQVSKFKQCDNPLAQINTYLYYLLQEALKRGYKLDSSKISFGLTIFSKKIVIPRIQADFEFNILLKTMKSKNQKQNRRFKSLKNIEPHPLFKVTSK